MESFGEKARAYLYAVLVHVIVIASLFIGLLWSRTATPVATPGQVIEADIIGAVAAPRPRPQSKPRAEPPKPVAPAPAPEPPKPEPPKPPEAKPPPTVQRNDNREQEKIAEVAEQKAEEAKRAQDEKHRQQQIELDEEKKREEAEAKQKTKQAEIAKQLDEIRQQREKAAKQTRLAQEKMKQLDDLQHEQSQPQKRAPAADVPEAETAKTGMNGNDSSKLAAYYSAIQLAVNNNWMRPPNAPAGLRCRVHIIQIRGGTVLSANIVPPCSVDPATRTSIEQAVMKASPLPYQGFEKEFSREFNFDFSYDG